MCETCGCSDPPSPGRALHPHDHAHPHADVRPGGGPWREPRPRGRAIELDLAVLGRNDRAAAENRAFLRARGILALNLVSSPGAGKTALLERAVRALGAERPVAVIEGDQETPLDAERIRAAGCPAVQLNTGRGCHLDAEAVGGALRELDPPPGALVFIENVGNLVCPALFDLGERAKVLIASMPEGEEKPLKYPHMFRASALVLLNKADLGPLLGFDAARFTAGARAVHPEAEVLEVSARTGAGLPAWYDWIRRRASETPG